MARLCSTLLLPSCHLLRRPAAAAVRRASSTPTVASDTPPYYTARITCLKNIAETLSESLLCFGATSASIDEIDQEAVTDQIIITSIFTSDQDVDRCISKAGNSIGLKELLHYEITCGRDDDWVKNSQETFHPINVADGLWIIPAWKAPIDIDATNIILDPGMAFGTGDHPTTKLCLLLLYEKIKGGEKFFDYGTGSGILCIAALKLGAEISIGVDIDPQAITAARMNASLNGIHPEKMQFYMPPDRHENSFPSGAKDINLDESNISGWELYKEKGKYDVVIANILLNPLVALVDEITSYAKPGGIIGLSGIICEQVPEIQKYYSKYLDCMTVKEMNGWACICGKRKVF